MISENFVYLGAIISVSFGLSYVIKTFKGKTKPNRVTWFLWFLAPMIAFASQLGQGVGPQILVTFTAGFNPLLVLIAAFVSHKSVWKITRLDIVCGACSLLGLILWAVTKEPNLAILFSIIADAMAGVPTIMKSYTNPETESGFVFLGGIIATVLTLLTIDKWLFQTYAFSAYILSICLLLFFLIEVRPRLKLRNA